VLHGRRLIGIIAAVILALGGWVRWAAVESRSRPVDAALWFDEVRFSSPRIGGALTAPDLARIERVAVDEVRRAFAGLRLRVSTAPAARYHVRVAQEVRDARFRRPVHVAGQSRAMAGLGGGGLVSFELLASGAVVYAPPELDRAALIDAIGRGVGRAAIHEFAHQLLPRAPLHASRDRSSYEFYSAGRFEQYYGELRWDLAGPLLRDRFAAP
jgi:hypothetical protein